MRVKSTRRYGSRGAYDRETRERNEERYKFWKEVLRSKDPRKLGEFLRKNGILDGTPRFVHAFEMCHAYWGTPSPRTSLQPDDAACAPRQAKSPDVPQ